MKPAYVTIPAGTRISVRTIDAVDSTYSVVGDRFQAALEEPLMLEGNVISHGRFPRLWPADTIEGVRNVHRQIAATSGADRDCSEWKDGASGDGRI